METMSDTRGKIYSMAMKTLLFLAGIAIVHAQSFEVASVKMSPPRQGTAAYTSVDSDPSMVRYSNITLKNLLAMAYHMDARLVDGPTWIDEVPYDVAAKLPPNTPKDKAPAMLQTLLAERFQMAVHRQKKEQKAFLLIVGKNGPQLKEGLPEGVQNQMLKGRIMGRAMSMSTLAGMLARFLEYQVVDRTGLQGNYDIDLKFAPDNSDLISRVQEQLGLKLETGKALVETLVVDKATRVPTEN